MQVQGGEKGGVDWVENDSSWDVVRKMERNPRERRGGHRITSEL